MPTNYGKILKDGVNYSHDAADSISYINTTSGLTATDVQAALDEINSNIPTDYVSKANGGTFDKTIVSKGNINATAVSGSTQRSMSAIGYGTTDKVGQGIFVAGNNIPEGTDGNCRGRLTLFGTDVGRTDVYASASTGTLTINLPEKGGTLALNDEFVPASGGTFSGNLLLNRLDGTTSSVGTSQLVLGNNIASGTTGNSTGRLVIYGEGVRYADLKATNVTSNRNFEFPNASGTLALTDDIPTDYVSKASGGTFGGKITINGAGLQTIQGGVAVGGNITASNSQSTATTTKENIITTGNSTATGTSGNQRGNVRIYSDNIGYVQLRAANGTTGNRTLYLPDKNGKTLACTTDDISQFNNDSGYVTANNAVRQLNQTGSSDYRVLLSYGASSADQTNRAHKSDNLTFNPSTKDLSVGTSHFKCVGAQQLDIEASDETNKYGTIRWGVYQISGVDSWVFGPYAKDAVTLGSPTLRWSQVYAKNTTISTSDRNYKKDIEDLGTFAKDFIMDLKPVSYRYKENESGRIHYGLIAQDVEETLEKYNKTSMDFAGLCKDIKTVQHIVPVEEEYIDEDGNTQIRTTTKLDYEEVPGEYEYALRYAEFLAPLIKTVQLQQEEINELKKRLDELEKR